MRHYQTYSIIIALALILLVAACDAAPATDIDGTVEARFQATVEFKEAVETSVAQTKEADTADQQEGEATPAPAEVAEAPETAPEPAEEPDSPAAEEEPFIIVQTSPVTGNGGNEILRGSSDENQGRVILLPGFAAEAVSEPMVFNDRLAIQIEVFDTRVGLSDGDGIEAVNFDIVDDDGNGEVVYSFGVDESPYCAFGSDESGCKAFVFAETENNWPDSEDPILNGAYQANINIVPVDGEVAQWRWKFNIEIPGQPNYQPPVAPQENNTTRINNITLDGNRYVVDFETFGFEAKLPGQHVHFFFNTVPKKQAGVPGKGPWQLYPAEEGQKGTSPFTMYRVGDKPAKATKMCILVANPDHSINLGTGNCFDLP